ncbi:mitochondrial 54S ribosomal protein YmL35 [Malassezia vespertilionis]|uniref:Mrpl35p n=1 Tax=Malassezia vespertilionis TaxID=2020962 RepID=A0A2N1JC15_9BASI|nr:mitochondrial 54S ribosomal protein YmL35 [Malassezia vespertilionis]PKI84094.1 hypothetical protein MVES_002107 [Malassezia vespertilionis]WFD06878.1 mitochondrial 54S ribosomal protein YmL35 [Malassezia vespertilionis]
MLRSTAHTVLRDVRPLLGRRYMADWKPAVQSGKVPVYDEALKFVAEDAATLGKRHEQIQRTTGDPKEKRAMLDALEIAREINIPSVRAQFAQGAYDMQKPVFRHLREQAWRRGGALEQLTERLQCMHVLPDVVPDFTPTVDLQVSFGEGEGIGDHGGSGGDILSGVFLEPEQTMDEPQICATPFHTDERMYTVMMVDPDAPHSDSFQTYVHWMVTNVPLSATKNTLPQSHTPALSYIPPHPQQGTPYHRYTTLLFEQCGSEVPAISREQTTLQEVLERYHLVLRGIHFWRARWTEKNKGVINKIYKEILHKEVPRYGQLPREDRLKDDLGVRHSKYY